MSLSPIRPALLSVLFVGLSSLANATVVSGRVTNSSGAGIPNIDLDFLDRDTGQSIALTNDKTDILGFFAINVPNGRYDVQFEPDPGVRYVAHEERDVRVEGSPISLDQELASGWFLSGHVVNPSGQPIAGLDLDLFDVVADNVVFIANGITDAFGNFSLVVETGTYHVEIEPPVGSPWVPKRVENIAATADVALGTLPMTAGVHLRGFVRNPTSAAVAAAVVRTLDPLTGDEIFNIRNNTDVTGWYDLMVAPAAYNLQVVPPDGAPLLPRVVAGAVLSADQTLPPILLDAGVVVSGRVNAAGGGPAAGTDLDFTESLSGIERFTPRDNADDNGDYAISIPPGVHDVSYNPVSGAGLAPHRLNGEPLMTSTVLPTVTLQTARTVTGVVRNGSGVALSGVDLDFILASTGEEILTNDDNSGATGVFSVGVPSGTYDIEFNPVAGSGYGQITLLNRTISGTTNLGTINLPAATSASPLSVSPSSGSVLGGTLVTVTGSNFAPGANVRLGGRSLSGVVQLNAVTLQGTTRVHPAGLVDLEVENPGAAPVFVSSAFQFVHAVVEPTLTVAKDGPLNTDVRLSWTATGAESYSIFRAADPASFSQNSGLLNVVAGTSYRDDGAASPSGPNPILFYLVH